jgi:hypothetical protein
MLGICLLVDAVLRPHRLLPADYTLGLVRGADAEASFGATGRIALLAIAAALLAAAWLVITDGLARTYADAPNDAPKMRRYSLAVTTCTAITLLTATIPPPISLTTIATILTLLATVVLPPTLWLLNYRHLPRTSPTWTHPHRLDAAMLALSFAICTALTLAYCYVTLT